MFGRDVPLQVELTTGTKRIPRRRQHGDLREIAPSVCYHDIVLYATVLYTLLSSGLHMTGVVPRPLYDHATLGDGTGTCKAAGVHSAGSAKGRDTGTGLRGCI